MSIDNRIKQQDHPKQGTNYQVKTKQAEKGFEVYFVILHSAMQIGYLFLEKTLNLNIILKNTYLFLFLKYLFIRFFLSNLVLKALVSSHISLKITSKSCSAKAA